MKYGAVITAAGSSSRMGLPVKKEYLPLCSGTVLSASVGTFLSLGIFSALVITIPAGTFSSAAAAVSSVLAGREPLPSLPPGICGGFFRPGDGQTPPVFFAEGGKTRQESVYRGLSALEGIYGANCFSGPQKHGAASPDIVLIHDGARPWISPSVITAVIENVQKHEAAVPVIPLTDTPKEIAGNGSIVRHLHRSSIVSVQTPQGFMFGKLLEAHRRAAEDGCEYTDDAEIWARYAGTVYTCPGETGNRKITYRNDIQI